MDTTRVTTIPNSAVKRNSHIIKQMAGPSRSFDHGAACLRGPSILQSHPVRTQRVGPAPCLQGWPGDSYAGPCLFIGLSEGIEEVVRHLREHWDLEARAYNSFELPSEALFFDVDVICVLNAEDLRRQRQIAWLGKLGRRAGAPKLILAFSRQMMHNDWQLAERVCELGAEPHHLYGE